MNEKSISLFKKTNETLFRKGLLISLFGEICPLFFPENRFII